MFSASSSLIFTSQNFHLILMMSTMIHDLLSVHSRMLYPFVIITIYMSMNYRYLTFHQGNSTTVLLTFSDIYF